MANPKIMIRNSSSSSVLAEVLVYIKPSTAEKRAELKFADEVQAQITANLDPGLKAVITGSVAKGTFLKDRKDLDIFVLFPSTFPKSSLESAIINIMKRSFPQIGYQVSYAEHPYVRFRYHGRKIDLVPAYKISNSTQRISAVDRSVLHTSFVKAHLSKNEIDSVLLLKSFLKSNELYGAEIKVQGFSGYLCELLIIWAGSFEKLIKKASNWKAPIFIDLAKHHKSKNGIFASNYSMVVIDPTDPNRNVAAALSEENFTLFVALCKKFIKKPDRKLLLSLPKSFEEKFTKKAKGKKSVLITMPRPDVVDDVLWGQIWKLSNQLKRHLEDYEPVDLIADDSRRLIRLGIITNLDKLSDKLSIIGPPLDMLKHAQDFRSAHKGAKFAIKNDHVCAITKRKTTKIHDSIVEFFKSHNLSNRGSHIAFPIELILIELQ